jgi:pimeloyl-ACP methyl ester carboxylesterase
MCSTVHIFLPHFLLSEVAALGPEPAHHGKAGRQMGRHLEHRVEGTEPHLNVRVYQPESGRRLPPVLLLHGFGSSAAANWNSTGWIRALTDAGRRVITMDLPGHGGSAVPEDVDSYTPSRIRADMLQVIQDSHVFPKRDGDPSTGVDLLGYSMGSRLAWEFGGTQPELVRRMVLGGPGATDPLAAFDLDGARRFLAGGPPPEDERTADLLSMVRAGGGNDLFALLTMVEAVKTEPFTPAETVPRVPLLLVAGDADEYAASAQELADLSGSAEVLWLPGRTHANAVTSHVFKTAAIDFLAG